MRWKLGGLFILIVGGLLGLATTGRCRRRRRYTGRSSAHGPRDEKLVALTFDDGPNRALDERRLRIR